MDSSVIIETARGWVGTRFHHQGRLKGVGVDCIGLVAGVAAELGMEFRDRVDYSREPKDGQLKDALEEYLVPSELGLGCVALFRMEKEPQHVGIISDYRDNGLGLIHAYMQARKVVEHNLDASWREKIIACYAYPIVTQLEF